MTTTRATLPFPISFSVIVPKSPQIIAKNGNNDFSDMMRMGLQSSSIDSKIKKDLSERGCNNACDGRPPATDTRRSGTTSQSLKIHGQAVHRSGCTRRSQGWGSVEGETGSTEALSRKSYQTRKQKLKAGRIRLSKKFVAQSSLTVFQDLRDDLSWCYAVSIIAVAKQQRQPSLCLFAQDEVNRYGGGREDTHMFTTIGNPLSQVYPYILMNYAPGIFGGSEVAG